MKFKPRTVRELAEMICGDADGAAKREFAYRSSSKLTRFFRECDTDYVHDGTTRAGWVSQVIEDILSQPHSDADTPPEEFLAVIRTLMDLGDARYDDPDRIGALTILNASLAREGFQAFYGEDKIAYLQHVATQRKVSSTLSPQRPLSKAERIKREALSQYLDSCSEDELIEQILLPLFRQRGFHRITAAGHKDKALEYGKDIWMKYVLPTTHCLYFGIQVKRDKLDAAGMTKNVNVSEVLDQTRMMLGHEIFDPEINRKVLVDHAFIIAGGEITKSARNWIVGRLDASQRRDILFMDRDEILDLFTVSDIDVPTSSPS